MTVRSLEEERGKSEAAADVRGVFRAANRPTREARAAPSRGAAAGRQAETRHQRTRAVRLVAGCSLTPSRSPRAGAGHPMD